MHVSKEMIESHDSRRYVIFNKHDEDSSELTPEEDKEVDDLAKIIIDEISEGYKTHKLTFEFVMHHLSRIGMCPNLLNDDNGHWAVTCDGYQAVPEGLDPQDLTMTCFVEAVEWKNTPEEALIYFLNEDK